MSGFTESGLERKLAELNSTQVSIQTLSLWLLHHKKHCQSIVKIWYKEFLKAQEHRKLTFLYLANDVIQNSKKKPGGEYGKGFAPVLKKALEYMARNPDDKIKKNILRILKIWEERGIYEPPLIKDFESSYRKTWDDLHGPDVDELLEEAIENPKRNNHHKSSNKNGRKPQPPLSGKDKDREREARKRHHHQHQQQKSNSSNNNNNNNATPSNKSGTTDPSTSTESGATATTTTATEGGPQQEDETDSKAEAAAASIKKRIRSKEIENLRKRAMLEDDMNTIEEWEVDGVSQMEIKLSPSPYKDPPTEEELIVFVKSLEKMPSTDAKTRGRIANLPPEVSDAKGVDMICIDSDVTRDLQTKIKSALELLTEYNVKLDKELEDRKTVSMKLQDLICFQKDLLTQAEHRLEEHQQYGKILTRKLEEMKSHVQSMPDLSKLPSVTDGLAPLPSAGDLFNI